MIAKPEVMHSMQVDGSTIIPSFRYHDAHAAIDWLERILGFSRKSVFEGPNGTVAHAELTLGQGMIMLGSASNTNPYAGQMAQPQDLDGKVTSPVYVVVPDCNPVYARVKAEGAEILGELKTMDYGGQSFSVRDPEGYLWSVGEYDPWAPQASNEA